MKKNDLLVVLCCDGAEKINQEMIDFLTERKCLDFKLLQEKGFANYNEKTGRYKMRSIEDIMGPNHESYPNNLLHMFGTYTDNWGITDDDYFRGRKINFM